MNSLIDNQGAYQYNVSIQSQLCEICKPIITASSASAIGYSRVYPNGKAIFVGTDSTLLKHYFSHISSNGLFFKKYLSSMQGNKFFLLWPDKAENNLYSVVHSLGIWNGFNVYIKRNEYMEAFMLMGNTNDNNVQNFCINNLKLVDCFLETFKEKASTFIDNVNDKKMVFFNGYSELSNNKKSKFDNLLIIKKVPFYIGNEKVYLTKREALCLSMFAFGYSIKEVALKLNLSPRTIESYLANIRFKSKMRFKLQLKDFVHNPENSIIQSFSSLILN